MPLMWEDVSQTKLYYSAIETQQWHQSSSFPLDKRSYLEEANLFSKILVDLECV